MSMDSTGSRCPEDSNSTDCLLRTLLQFLNEQQKAKDAEINWDPISFAFTLPIGLLALIFALMTIIQAILATGKSRRITSDRAIGQWSKKRQKTWSWTEMNCQYTACTPVLRETSLLAALQGNTKTLEGRDHVDEKIDKHKIRHHFTLARSELFQGIVAGTKRSITTSILALRGVWTSQLTRFRFWSETPTPSPPAPQQPSAAWLEFFKEIGLDKLEFPHWDGSTRKTSADYLPDDLVAAPAYGQVGAIIAAAATAGIEKLYIDQQNYPTVLGHGFQIDFRQHPILGLIGAYSRYENASKPDQSGSLGFGELRLAMQHARGHVPSKENMNVYAKSTRRHILGRWCVRQKEVASKDNTSEDKGFFIRLDSLSEAYLPLIVGLSAYTPKYVPPLFPLTSMWTTISCPLTALAWNGTYWAKVNILKYSDTHIYQWPDPHFAPSWAGFKWHDVGSHDLPPDIDEMYHELELSSGIKSGICDPSSKMQPSQAAAENATKRTGDEAVGYPTAGSSHRAERQAAERTKSRNAQTLDVLAVQADSSVRGPKVIDGHGVVLHMCLKLLDQPKDLTWFFEASPVEQISLRYLILEQVKQVDQWLDSREAKQETRSIILCSKTMFLSLAENIMHRRYIKGVNDAEYYRGKGHVSATILHLKTIEILQQLFGELDGGSHWDLRGNDEELVQELKDLVDVYPTTSDPSTTYRDVMKVLVNDFKVSPDQSDRLCQTDNTDDVIIYRCLMMILLFRTAADSSTILDSGLWDMVVPFL